MRPKYDMRGLVLMRTGTGEANAHVAILTEELGLIRARAQGVRRSGAKLASALSTLAESELALVRGKEGWRLTGAVLAEPWFSRLPDADARERAGRIAHLMLRLVAGETPDDSLYPTYLTFLRALEESPPSSRDAVEVLAALYVLSALGLDDLAVSPMGERFAPAALARAQEERSAYVARVNHGIAASGL